MIAGSPEGAQTVTANLDVRLKPACSRSGFAVESAERLHDDQTRVTSSIGGHRDHEGRLFSEPRPAFPGYVPTQAGVVNLDGQATRVVDGFVGLHGLHQLVLETPCRAIALRQVTNQSQGGQVGLHGVNKNSAGSHVVNGNWVGTVPGHSVAALRRRAGPLVFFR